MVKLKAKERRELSELLLDILLCVCVCYYFTAAGYDWAQLLQIPSGDKGRQGVSPGLKDLRTDIDSNANIGPRAHFHSCRRLGRWPLLVSESISAASLQRVLLLSVTHYPTPLILLLCMWRDVGKYKGKLGYSDLIVSGGVARAYILVEPGLGQPGS